jgi:predicted anti-sigma-YlaC factor YlaD
MDCHLFREHIFAYAEKALPAAMMEELDKHMAECGECSLIYSEFAHLAELIRNGKTIEPLPFAETRILQGVLSRLEKKERTILNRIVTTLQPVYLSLIVLIAIAIGILIGFREEQLYSSNQKTEEQIESMRIELNVPDFMDEENTSIN